MTSHRAVWYSLVLVGLAGRAAASPVVYNVTINTSSVSGNAGSLDFNFGAGVLGSQAAFVQVVGLTTDGKLAASPVLSGDASGTLPGTVTLDNGGNYNDYFGGFKYGSTLSFGVSLYGPALSSPDGKSGSGSTFAFSMFSDAAGVTPALTTDTTDGFAFTVDVNLDGTTTVHNYSTQTTGFPSGPISATPEPGALVLAGTGVLMTLGRRRTWRGASR